MASNVGCYTGSNYEDTTWWLRSWGYWYVCVKEGNHTCEREVCAIDTHEAEDGESVPHQFY